MRGGKHLFYLGLLLAIIVLLNLRVPAARRVKGALRETCSPLLNTFAAGARRLRDAGARLKGAAAEERARRALLQELAELRARAAQARVLEEENRELRRLMGFRERPPHRLVLCAVAARGDVSGWWQTLTLDRGSADGIRPDRAVLSPDGLVGRTTLVAPHTSEVLLITDPNCRVACRLEGRHAYGIVRGMGVTLKGEGLLEMLAAPEPCRLDFLPREEPVAAGSAVVTSGLGGVFPEGLPVGRVLRTGLDASRLYQRAEVAPAADLRALRYVFVWLEDAGGRPEEGGRRTPGRRRDADA